MSKIDDLKAYEQAFDDSNTAEMERLRLRYPHDARFNEHLRYAPKDPAKQQRFKDVQKEYIKKERPIFAPTPYVKFVNLLEARQITKAKNMVYNLPKTSPYKAKLMKLLPYL